MHPCSQVLLKALLGCLAGMLPSNAYEGLVSEVYRQVVSVAESIEKDVPINDVQVGQLPFAGPKGGQKD